MLAVIFQQLEQVQQKFHCFAPLKHLGIGKTTKERKDKLSRGLNPVPPEVPKLSKPLY
jgi:hypothetical protein